MTLTKTRLILYYPVSALVTLFANILQNPQDARARSDLKLMSSVCQYLAELCNADSNIHCRRMLSICSEFERIARVALEKAEREIRGRGKRKAPEKDATEDANNVKTDKTGSQQQPNTSMHPPLAPATKTPNMQSSLLPQNGSNTSSPSGLRTNGNQAKSPLGAQSFNSTSFGGGAPQSPYSLNSDLNHNTQFSQAPPSGNLGPFSQVPGGIMFPQDHNMSVDMNWGGDAAGMSLNGSFQQPFVPQDLWQMPMTLEWDWADVLNTSSAGYGFDEMGGMGGDSVNGGGGHNGQ